MERKKIGVTCNGRYKTREMPREDTQWKPGQSGNPKGAPHGRTSAEKLRRALLDGIEDAGNWLEKELRKKGKGSGKKGSEAYVINLLKRAGLKDPVGTLRMMVSLLPKEVRAQIGPDVDSVIRLVREMDRVTAPGEETDGSDRESFGSKAED